eukprot:621741-Prorocentrum_lima.AAC.1
MVGPDGIWFQRTSVTRWEAQELKTLLVRVLERHYLNDEFDEEDPVQTAEVPNQHPTSTEGGRAL